MRRAADQLVTERLVLRPITIDDVDLLVDLDSDPEVMRYLTNGRPSTRDEVEDVVRGAIGGRWIALERATGGFLGWIGMYPTGDAEYEVGWRLRRDAWGKGLATEGARALIDRAFTEQGAQRVFAETMVVNTRSRAVMERCGLTYVRTFHLEFDDPVPGTELGEVEYAVTRDEWASRRSTTDTT